MKNLILFIGFLSLSTTSFASHILGGTMYYEHIIGDSFQITMEIYKDCSPNSSQADFDDPASFTIYKGNTTIPFLNLSENLDSRNILASDSTNSCLSSSCIEVGIYTFSVSLPYDSSGYHISYERCCRRASIVNIPSTNSFGFTMTIFITKDALFHQNNSPKFNGTIPPFYEANTLLNYDASAIDIDGDSLSYKLIEPYSGASQINPRPNQASAPPYTTISYAPPFSVSNMIGSNPPLTIDSLTGIINVTPIAIGLYVVAYSVEDYKNGQLMSTIRREFTLPVISPTIYPYSFSGQVTNFDASIIIDKATVYLYEIENETIWHKVDSSTLDTSKRFHFNQIPNGDYRLKAIPDSSSIYFGKYLPGYVNSSFFPLWYFNLSPIDLCEAVQNGVNIELIPIIDSLGTQTITGVIYYENTKTPVPNLDLMLLQITPLLNPQWSGYTRTNEQGEFEFENLIGSDTMHYYRVFVDSINSNIRNTPFLDVTLPLDSTSIFVQLELLDTHLERVFPVATQPLEAANNPFMVYPNPTNGVVTLQGKPLLTSDSWITVYDQLGRAVENFAVDANSSDKFSFQLTGSSGLYFLQIKSEEEIYTVKVLLTQ